MTHYWCCAEKQQQNLRLFKTNIIHTFIWDTINWIGILPILEEDVNKDKMHLRDPHQRQIKNIYVSFSAQYYVI